MRIEDIASSAKLRTSPAIKDSAVVKSNRDYGKIALNAIKIRRTLMSRRGFIKNPGEEKGGEADLRLLLFSSLRVVQ
jgi:hypothetical protein